MGFEELWAKKIELGGSGHEVLREAGKAVNNLREEMRSGVNLDAKYICNVSRKRQSHDGVGSGSLVSENGESSH